MLKDRTVIVFGEEHYNTLGIVRSLGEEGINPIFIAILGKANIASSSRYVLKCHKVKDYLEGCQLLLNVYGDYSPDNLPIVITSDDEQVQYMDEHYELFAGRFIFFNAGETGRITRYMNKYKILELASENGFKTLLTEVVKRGELPQKVPYPIITKAISPNVGGWKSDVFICENQKELEEAYKKIQSPTVLLQQYLEKKNELSLEGFSIEHGKQIFIAISISHKYNIKGYYSPYSDIDNFKDKELYELVKNLFKKIRYEGIFEIDFLVGQDDSLYFSEINFRNSAWNYAATCAGMNMQTLWAESMINGKIPQNAYHELDEKFTAMTEPIDYQKRVVERGYSLEEWCKDFKNAKCKYYYNEKDLQPFFVMLENNKILR